MKSVFFWHAPYATRRRRCAGFTLLEVILALALSILVLLAIAMAVDLHLRLLHSRRAHVERAQLARSLLTMMASDIRGAVQYKPIDISELEAMLDGLDLSALSSDQLAGLAGGGGLENLDPTALADLANQAAGGGETQQPSSQEISTTVEPPPKMGIYGNEFEIQIDVSRLPRIDQYNPLVVRRDASLIDIPSDVKTVAYYLQSDQPGASLGPSSLGAAGAGGLVRRELDRAVTQWAVDHGQSPESSDIGELIAAEVSEIGFQYFDGEQWLSEWDSNEQGRLPPAIEVSITFTDPEPPGNSMGGFRAGTEVENSSVYRLVVHLPIAEPAEEDDGSHNAEGSDDSQTDSPANSADDF